jgi:membrane peptidoglycan carboxypeptidase
MVARGPDSGSRQEDFWSPRNADGSTGGMFTMRRGLENSINLVTAHLLADGINKEPEESLAHVCAAALAAKRPAKPEARGGYGAWGWGG